MTARELVTNLNRRGFRVSVAAGGIALDGPPDIITDEDRAAIKTHRAALLDLLAHDNSNPPACAEGDRVRGYDGERWKRGTVLSVLPDDGWTAPDAIGMVMVQLDHTEHQTVFRRERLWPVEGEEPPRPSP